MLSGPDSRSIERLGEYNVLRVVGEGGMGIVYEATERLSGRRVALKVLHSSLANNEGARDRFFGEMRIMSQLEHPNIVRSLSSAEIDRKLVMVLEYIDGRTLREAIEQHGRLPMSLAITVASAVASALGAAHGAVPAVVHRDLKPENVMLASDGRIKVMDFGIAKVLDGGNKTRTTQAVGTVKYMSPEQAGGGDITPQTDLYALGLLIYEMLTGRAPFESTSLLALLRHHCESEPPPLPEDVRREVPLALEQLMFQLLAKEPAARPADALTVLHALIALNVAQPVVAASAPGPAITPPFFRSEARSGSPNTTGAPTPGSVAVSPRAHPGARRDDTIALILKLEPKRRWPYYVAALVAFSAAAAVVVGLVLYFGPSSNKRSGSRAAAGPGNGPPGCRPEDICAPFTLGTPTAVPAEAVMAESDRLARQLDPRARLVSFSALDAVSDGLIDITRSFGTVTSMYALPDASIMVMLKADGFRAVKLPTLLNDDPLAAPACTLKRAWDAGLGPAHRPELKSTATLSFDDRAKVAQWRVSSGKDYESINGATCAVKDNPLRGRR